MYIQDVCMYICMNVCFEWLGLPGDRVKFAAGEPSGKEDLPGLFLNNFFTLCLLEYKFMYICYNVVHIKLVHLRGLMCSMITLTFWTLTETSFSLQTC